MFVVEVVEVTLLEDRRGGSGKFGKTVWDDTEEVDDGSDGEVLGVGEVELVTVVVEEICRRAKGREGGKANA